MGHGSVSCGPLFCIIATVKTRPVLKTPMQVLSNEGCTKQKSSQGHAENMTFHHYLHDFFPFIHPLFEGYSYFTCCFQNIPGFHYSYKKPCQFEVQEKYFWTSFKNTRKFAYNDFQYHRNLIYSVQQHILTNKCVSSSCKQFYITLWSFLVASIMSFLV